MVQFFPFFTIGASINKTFLSYLRERKCKIFKCCLLILCISILAFFAGPELNAMEFRKYNVITLADILQTSVLLAIMLNFLVLLSSILICLSLLSLFPDIKFFSQNGDTTLFILCVHVIIYKLITILQINYVSGIVIAMISIPLMTVFAKSKYSKYILYPITNIIQYAKK